MIPLLNSSTKTEILCWLVLRGGATGRRLATQLGRSPTPVFKALRQLEADAIISHSGGLYAFNTRNPYYAEIVRLVLKYGENESPFLPRLPADRRVDAISVLKLKALLGPAPQRTRLSDALPKIWLKAS